MIRVPRHGGGFQLKNNPPATEPGVVAIYKFRPINQKS